MTKRKLIRSVYFILSLDKDTGTRNNHIDVISKNYWDDQTPFESPGIQNQLENEGDDKKNVQSDIKK